MTQLEKLGCGGRTLTRKNASSKRQNIRTPEFGTSQCPENK